MFDESGGEGMDSHEVLPKKPGRFAQKVMDTLGIKSKYDQAREEYFRVAAAKRNLDQVTEEAQAEVDKLSKDSSTRSPWNTASAHRKIGKAEQALEDAKER